MRWVGTWFVLLTSVCILGPYVLGVGPKTARERVYLAIAIAFLAWVLPLMIALR